MMIVSLIEFPFGFLLPVVDPGITALKRAKKRPGGNSRARFRFVVKGSGWAKIAEPVKKKILNLSMRERRSLRGRDLPLCSARAESKQNRHVQNIGSNKYHHPWRSTAWEIHPVLKIEAAIELLHEADRDAHVVYCLNVALDRTLPAHVV